MTWFTCRRDGSAPFAALAVLALSGCATSAVERRFALRDPLWRDSDLGPVKVRCHASPSKEDPRHVSCAPQPYQSPLIWDGVDNLALRPLSDALRVAPGGEAIDVNSLDEVPDSAWFTNRLGARPLTLDELRLGGCTPELLVDPARYRDRSWVVDKGKSGGASGGFRADIPGKGKYLFKSDDGLHERPTAASVIGLAVYHAVGFNTACDQIVYFKPSLLALKPGLRSRRNFEASRPFDQAALDKLLAGNDKRGELVRMGASAWIRGYIIGPFRYQGTRADDPNDVIPHEDRRELRASRLVAAWLARFDAREANTLDSWVVEGKGPPDGSPGKVIHYMLDTSEALGSRWSWDEISRRLNHAYVVDFGAIAQDFLTIGIRPRPWDRVRLRSGHGAFGYYGLETFEPDRWKNEYPNAAFSRMTERDAAWMARKLAHFTPEMVATLAAMGQFSDPDDTAYIRAVLEGRLQKILQRYLTRLSPVSDLKMEGPHHLCAVDLAQRRGLPGRYRHTARLVDPEAARRGGAAGFEVPVTERGGGAFCAYLVHRANDWGPPDDAPERYVRVRIGNGAAPGLLTAHLYDLGPSRGYRLAGIER